MYLGQMNTIFVDSASGLARTKTTAVRPPSLGLDGLQSGHHEQSIRWPHFRGVNGPASRVTWWAVGDGSASGSSSNGGAGTNDFSNGTVDALINVLAIGREHASARGALRGPGRIVDH